MDEEVIVMAQAICKAQWGHLKHWDRYAEQYKRYALAAKRASDGYVEGRTGFPRKLLATPAAEDTNDKTDLKDASDAHKCRRVAEGQKVLSPAQAATILGISRVTLWRGSRDGYLPKAIRVSPGRSGYLRADIDAFIDTAKANL